uniref:Uncharacterized protein LOC100378855 n=1 Tax=Saccoglossus kowalevskii TaxID=10224 RepID=A0ABM0LZL5_SACKO|nr:PREDICTED: uncharacterized protein LOC100378855 [Saccoglossus kowalevskii]
MADKTDLSLSRRKNVHEREERNGHSEEVCDKSATERLLVLRLDDEGHSDFVEDPIPSCLQPNQNADLPELPELGVSSVKVPHPDNDPNTLVDLGMTFKTELVESIYQHSVVEVDDGSLAHRLNMRNGDIIHKINDFPLFDCEHGGVLDMFYNLDEEFDVTIRRQTEDNIDGGDSDDDQMMYVFTKFKLKMEITNNEVQIEVIAEFEEEYITKSDNEYPKLRCYYEGDCYIYTASSDSSLILSMTSSSSIAIIPAHINDDRGKKLQ